MNRFFIPPESISGCTVTIPNDVSSQIRKVLRLREGEIVQFLDNSGYSYESRIHYLDSKNLNGEIIDKRLADSEPSCCISLYIGLTQREKFEWILQKCTEAGVSRIIPMITERSLVRKTSDYSEKQERWKKILKEAAEQCGRGMIPEIFSPIPFSEAAVIGSDADVSVFCWESEKQKTLCEVLSPVRNTAKHVAVMIGPEGGFSEEEAAVAAGNCWIPVSLGKRIYRMETAAMAAVILSLFIIENN